MIYKKRLGWAMLVIPAWLTMLSQSSTAQFEDAAKWVPDSTNSIIMINSEKILDSEIAKLEKWKTERSKAFRSGAAFLPPSTKVALLATQIDYQFLSPIVSVGYFKKAGDNIDILEVSKRTNGNLTKVFGKDAVVLPTDTYMIQVEDNVLVTMAPGNRQMTERWVRSSMSGNANRLSPYLKQAIEFADNNADVIVAFDLMGAISEEEVTERLKASEIVSIREDEIPQLSKSIAGLEGLTLGITINDKITGSIKIDFAEEPVGMFKVGKDILIAVLKKNGLMIDDIASWSVASGPKQIRLSGPLSESGLRQVGMLVQQPLQDQVHYEGGDSSVNAATRSKQYFGDVQHVMNDLRNKNLNDLATYAKWFDRYAVQIDKLSVLGVDPAVLDYGTYVSDSFRDISNGLRGDNLQRATDVTSQRGFSIYNQNYWGYRSGNAAASYYYNRRSRRIETNVGTARGKDNAKQIFGEIESETAKVRRDMSEKYGIDF